MKLSNPYLNSILGNAEKARHTIISIMHHVSNKHVFSGLTHFPKCAHGPITVQKEWIHTGNYINFWQFFTTLNIGSKAMLKLRESIWGKKGNNLDDLEFMTGSYGIHACGLQIDLFVIFFELIIFILFLRLSLFFWGCLQKFRPYIVRKFGDHFFCSFICHRASKNLL